MKPCPFCAEQIQETAIKCRFCGSMLDGSAPPGTAHPPGQRMLPAPIVIFEGSPSWKGWFWSYVGAFASIIGILFWLPFLHFKRKALHYRISSRSIDYEVGVLSKRVETVPLWRVLDLELKQTLTERILGIATIHVMTKDSVTPLLVLRGLPASREIFDGMRDACEVARQQRVVEVV